MRIGSLWLWGAVLIALPTLGCGNRRMYPGPDRPREELSILSAEGGAFIVRIDDRLTRSFKTAEFEVLPGQHVLVVGYSRGTLGGTIEGAHIRMEVELAPGMEYRIVGEDDIGFWQGRGTWHATLVPVFP